MSREKREECCACGEYYDAGDEPLDFVYCPSCKKDVLDDEGERR